MAEINITLGTSVTGVLDDVTGKLTISGVGAMNNWTSSNYPLKLYTNTIKEVEIQEGVTSLGNYCFSSCSKLTSITIPSSVTSLGERCFNSCSALTSITNKAKTNQTIGFNAFDLTPTNAPIPVYGHSTNTNFKTAVSDTTKFTWNDLALEEIDAFQLGVNITGVLRTNGILTISGVGAMNNWTSSNYPLKLYTNTIKEVEIQEGVTSLGNYCFSSCSKLTSITIPNSVTSIGSYCFNYCSALTSITIPNSVTSLGTYCFNRCSALTSITIPNSVTSIGSYCFNYCSALTSITIPNSVASLGSECFSSCSSLTSITIPNSVTTLGGASFYGCLKLTTVEFQEPCKITNFANSGNYGLFERCSALTSITIPSSVTSLGNYCFSSCSKLTSITIPNSVTSIGSYCFNYCSALTSITIPNSVTSLGTYCFNRCSALTSITIPSSVKSLGDSCFYYCSKLTSITNKAKTNQTIGSNAFDLTPTNAPIPVYGYSTNTNFKTAVSDTTKFTWNEGMPPIEIPMGTSVVGKLNEETGKLVIEGSGAMDNWNSSNYPLLPYKDVIKEVEIQDSVTSLGNYCFSQCTALTSITIPNSVTSLGDSCFYYCSKLTSITNKAKTNQTIGSNAFDLTPTNAPIPVYGYSTNTNFKTAVSDTTKFTWNEILETAPIIEAYGSYTVDSLGQYRSVLYSLASTINPTNATDLYYASIPVKLHRYELGNPTVSVGLKDGQHHTQIVDISTLLVGDFQKCSGIVTSKAEWVGQSIVFKIGTDKQINAKYEFKQPALINLTEMFGSGNEPTKGVCDNLFGEFEDSGLYSTEAIISNNQSESGEFVCLNQGVKEIIKLGGTLTKQDTIQVLEDGSAIWTQNTKDSEDGGSRVDLEIPIITPLDKSLCPVISFAGGVENIISVGQHVSPSSYNLHYPTNSNESQIKLLTQHGKNKINTTDSVKPSLFKASFPVRKLVTATFATGDITKKIALKVVACNDMGENSTADGVTLYAAPELQWTYIIADKKVKIQWQDNSLIDKQYKIRYKINNGSYQYDSIEGDGTTLDKLYSYEIPLTETQVAEVSLCVVSDTQEHLYSKPVLMSKANDVNLKPPSGFDVEWLSKDELQFKWNDDYAVDVDYEFIYTIDGGEEQVIIIPSSNMSGSGGVLTHTIILKELERVEARVRMRWALNASEFAHKTALHNLARPENVQFEIVQEGTRITWDRSIFAENYKVFTEERELALVTQPEALISQEINGDVYVVAYRDGFISEPSDYVFIKSKPNAPVNINAKFVEMVNGYNFNVSFIDNSEIESSYRLEYSVDEGDVDSLVVNSDEYEQGTIVTFTFTTPDIEDHISIKVISINEIGENTLGEPVEIYISPQPRWTFLLEENQILLDWVDKFDFETSYKIQYLVNGTEYHYDYVDTSNIEIGSHVQHKFPMSIYDYATARICCVSDKDHFYSKPITVSKDRDVTLLPPPNFEYKWVGKGLAEFSWKDNYSCEDGFEFTYSINDGMAVTDFIPSTSVTGEGIYTYRKQLQGYESMLAKVRMKWDLNKSQYSSQSVTYIPIEAEPVQNLLRHRTETGITIEWDAQSYVDMYEIHYIVGGEETIIETQYNSYVFDIDYSNEKLIEIYIVTRLAGGAISDKSDSIIFTPTELKRIIETIKMDVCKEEYHLNSAFMHTDTNIIYHINTNSVDKTNQTYHLSTKTIERFQMEHVPIETTIWQQGIRQLHTLLSKIITPDLIQTKHLLEGVFVTPTQEKYDIETYVKTLIKDAYTVNMEINKPRIATFGDSITAGFYRLALPSNRLKKNKFNCWNTLRAL